MPCGVHCTYSRKTVTVTNAFEFIETSAFEKAITDLVADEDYRALQKVLLDNPEAGDVIQGTGGLRKIRVPRPGTGKSGGVRVIYLQVKPDTIFMLLAYPKNRKDTLTAYEKTILNAMADRLKKG